MIPVKQILLNLLEKYQINVSPYLKNNGYRCLYKATCSQYAVQCLKNYNVIKAIILFAIRLLSCNPINAYLLHKKGELVYG